MEIIVRATIIYLLVWVLVRATGKRELAELSAFELVLLVMIGDLVQQGVTQEDMSVTGAMLAVGTLAFWVVATSYMAFRFKRMRGIVEGHPVIVVHNGRIQHEALRTERITEDELVDAARQQGIDDLRKVRFGVLEADGKFSFLPRDGGGPQGRPRRSRAE